MMQGVCTCVIFAEDFVYQQMKDVQVQVQMLPICFG